MRILIVDDESLVRAAIRTMLEESGKGVTVAGEAAHGEEALDYLREYSVDLVFLDIRMPGLNGLDVMKLGQELSPFTEWIVLTGCSDFAYARDALRLGASEYLLKPVSPEELERAVRKCLQSKQKQLADLNLQFENRLMARLYHGERRHLEPLAEETGIGCQCHIYVIDSFLPWEERAERSAAFIRAVKQQALAFLDRETRMASFALPDGHIVAVGAWGWFKPSFGRPSIQHWFQKIAGLVPEHCGEALRLTAVQGESVPYSHIHEQVGGLLKRAHLRVVSGVGTALTAQRLQRLEEEPALAAASRLFTTLSEQYREGNCLSYMKALNECRMQVRVDRLSAPVRTHIRSFVSSAMNGKLPEGDEPEVWWSELSRLGERLIASGTAGQEPSKDLIDEVIAYVERNYRKDIGLGQIAKTLHVSPNYLSTLFHKKTGITFIKYVTKIRIQKAKDMLNHSNLSIQEIANAVNYSSTRHFTRIFTDLVGCYPSQYRNQHRENKLGRLDNGQR